MHLAAEPGVRARAGARAGGQESGVRIQGSGGSLEDLRGGQAASSVGHPRSTRMLATAYRGSTVHHSCRLPLAPEP
jgi:hypothetical protein